MKKRASTKEIEKTFIKKGCTLDSSLISLIEEKHPISNPLFTQKSTKHPNFIIYKNQDGTEEFVCKSPIQKRKNLPAIYVSENYSFKLDEASPDRNFTATLKKGLSIKIKEVKFPKFCEETEIENISSQEESLISSLNCSIIGRSINPKLITHLNHGE